MTVRDIAGTASVIALGLIAAALIWDRSNNSGSATPGLASQLKPMGAGHQLEPVPPLSNIFERVTRSPEGEDAHQRAVYYFKDDDAASYPVRPATAIEDVNQTHQTERTELPLNDDQVAAVFDAFEAKQKSPRGPVELRGANGTQVTLAGIDQGLEVEGPVGIIPHVRQLLDRLTAPAADGVALRAVGCRFAAAKVVAQLQTILAMSAAQVDDKAPSKVVAQPAIPGLSELIRELSGDVTAEAIDELGVIILKGEKKDVEEVVKIIRSLEKVGGIGAPNIRVVFLKHVNSESMAELLNGVYGQGQASSNAQPVGRSVSFLPVLKPNAVVVVGSTVDVESTLQLVAELDKPIDPNAEFEFVRLTHNSATDIARMLQEFYEQRPGLGPRFRLIVDAQNNGILLQGGKNDLTEAGKFIRDAERRAVSSVKQMKVIPLKHARADEVAAIIRDAIDQIIATDPIRSNRSIPSSTAPGTGSNSTSNQARNSVATPQLPAGRSSVSQRNSRTAQAVAVLQLLTRTAGGQHQVQQGFFYGVKLTPDTRMNTLVVSASRQSMLLLTTLIEQLDQPPTAVAEIRAFSLVNADASALKTLLESLFQSSPTLTTSPSISGGDSKSSSVVPLRITVDRRTNTILATGPGDQMQAVEAVIARLDRDDARQRKNTVIRLKNSPAIEVATALNEFLRSQRDLAQVDPNLVTTNELLEREVIVVPEEVSNSLLVSATPRYFEEILNLTSRLDEAPSQVIIQALLVEVDLNNTDELGVELGFQDSVLFDRSVVDNLVTLTQTNTSPNGVQTTTERVVSQESLPGFPFNNQPLGNNTAIRPSSVGSQGLSNLSVGRINGDLGFGGLVLSASSQSVNVLIRALAARRNIQVLSRPQIRTLDNQTAQIQVGQQVPVVDGVNVNTNGSANPLIRQDKAGIILTVTPRINPDGVIVMEAIAEKSQFRGQGVPIFVDANTGNVIESPVKDITTARTSVSVPSGQTVVIGGMITTLEDVIERKVPWLGDVPYLGSAFRYDSQVKRRTELLIFLTPRVISNPIDDEDLKHIEMKRIQFTEKDAIKIHGPLFEEVIEPVNPANGEEEKITLEVPMERLPVPQN